MRWGRLVALVGVLALVVGGVVVVRHLLGPDCTVTVADRSVGLGQDDAEAAATAVAAVVRRSGPASDARDAVSQSIDVDGQDGADVAAALSGRARAALVCKDGGAEASEGDTLDDQGLTGRAARVRADLEGRYGDLPLGGYAPGGVSTGHMPGSAHYEGRAIDVFFRPVNLANKADGWALAQYLVAHAVRLEVSTVIFDGRIWTARRSIGGWREYDIEAKGRSAAVLSVLEHRDHVHVDVAD